MTSPSPAAAKKYFGQRLKRREDLRFLTGQGNYVDDIMLPRMTYVAFLRSPHANAKVVSLDTAAAQNLPGVVRVVTVADQEACQVGKLQTHHSIHFSDGRKMNEATRTLLTNHPKFVGDIIAAVVAETKHAALEGVEAVAIAYEILPAVVDLEEAASPESFLIHPDLPSNLATDVTRGEPEKTAAAFARAAHVTTLRLVSNRLSGNPIEPRTYLADTKTSTGETTLWATSQNPHLWRRLLCKFVLRIPENKLRVIAPDIGGGFGPKVGMNAEVAIVTWLSRLLGRPVKWTSTRSEALQSDNQARDHVTYAGMAFDADGRIIGMKVDTIANLGAYTTSAGPSIPGNSYPQTITGLYTTENLHFRVRIVYTNTVTTGAYRGSGRPEATWVNERLLENGAREMGIDVIEMRRRNLIAAGQFPYPTPIGRVYDSGDPPALLDKLVKLSRYDELRKKQQDARAKGILMGIGVAAFLDKSGTGPSKALQDKGGAHSSFESATVRVHPDGKVTLLVGTHSHGQSHDTTYSQILADELGIDIDDIVVVEGDTGMVQFGSGTWGSRSASVGGAAIVKAGQETLAKARAIAAALFDLDPAEVLYENGFFSSIKTNRRLSFADIADIANLGGFNKHGGGPTPGLEAQVFYDPLDLNDPEAIHLAAIIIDKATGRIQVTDYFTADDCGRIINPMVVEGQIHGGLAQGIGQAMMEQVMFDKAGQLLTGSFLDYAMPRAVDMPPLQFTFIETPAPSNPLGVKGGSETGTIGPPAAIGNAVVDALWHLGVREVNLPMTPYSIWKTLQAAGIS